MTINSSCCSYIDTSAQMETSITIIRQNATRLQNYWTIAPLSLNQLEIGLLVYIHGYQGTQVHIERIFNLGLTILSFIMFAFIALNLFMTCLSHARKIESTLQVSLKIYLLLTHEGLLYSMHKIFVPPHISEDVKLHRYGGKQYVF